MTKEDAPEAAQVAAANSLLDRGWGKAVQAIVGPEGEDGLPGAIQINVIRPKG